MRISLVLIALVMGSAGGVSLAQQSSGYYCGSTLVTTTRCADGSLAIYRARELKPDMPSALPATVNAPRSKSVVDASTSGLLGKWHTNVPASVINREVNGIRWTQVFPGAVAGDLLINADGSFAWASYGGKTGRWVATRGSWPIELIDTVEGRRWKVGLDERGGGRRILIWDGDAIHYVGTR